MGAVGACRPRADRSTRVRVAANSPADGVALGELPLGDDAWVTLLVRDGDALLPHAELQLRAGDRLLILATSPEHVARLRVPIRLAHAAR